MDNLNIALDIPLGDSKSTVEISYLDLVKKYLDEHQEKTLNSLDQLDPFSAEEAKIDRKMEDYVRSLEKKYGTMITLKKKGVKQKVRVSDFADMGDGYDTDDSFIDDTEASEVVVAPTVSTKFGGFFVHEGLIEDVEDSIAEVEDLPPKKQIDKTNFKPALLKKNKSKQLLEKAMKCLSSSNKSRINNVKLEDNLKSPTYLTKSPNPVGRPPLNKENHTPHHSKDISKTKVEAIIKPTVKQEPSLKNYSSKENNQKSSPITQDSNTKPDPKELPSNLPLSVKTIIERLKHTIQASNSNKKRQFGPDFDKELVSLDKALSDSTITKSMRSAVLQYIEDLVNLKRKALLQRIRKEKDRCDSNNLGILRQKLTEAINKITPNLISSYEKEFINHQERLRQWHGEVSRIEALNEKCTQESEITRKPTRPMAPRKKFRWDDVTRTNFERILKLKLEEYKEMTQHDSPLDDFLKKFFLDSLVPLWPEGWMTVTNLWRNSNTLYFKYLSENGLQALSADANSSEKQSPVKNSVNNISNISKNDVSKISTTNLDKSLTSNSSITYKSIPQESPSKVLLENKVTKAAQLPSKPSTSMLSPVKTSTPTINKTQSLNSQNVTYSNNQCLKRPAQSNLNFENKILAKTLNISNKVDDDLEIISVSAPKRSSVPNQATATIFKNQQTTLQNPSVQISRPSIPTAQTTNKNSNVVSVSPFGYSASNASNSSNSRISTQQTSKPSMNFGYFNCNQSVGSQQIRSGLATPNSPNSGHIFSSQFSTPIQMSSGLSAHISPPQSHSIEQSYQNQNYKKTLPSQGMYTGSQPRALPQVQPLNISSPKSTAYSQLNAANNAMLAQHFLNSQTSATKKMDQSEANRFMQQNMEYYNVVECILNQQQQNARAQPQFPPKS